MRLNIPSGSPFRDRRGVTVAAQALRAALRRGRRDIRQVDLEADAAIRHPEAYRIRSAGGRVIVTAGALRGATYGLAWLADRVACGKLAQAATGRLQKPDLPIRYAKTTAAMYGASQPLCEYGKNGWLEQMDLAGPPYVSDEMTHAVVRFKRLCDILLLQRYNGVVLSDNIHMVTLDRLGIHGRRDPARLRVLRYRPYYREMIDYAAALGLDVVVYSDEIMATARGLAWIGPRCPANPRVWRYLREKTRELVERYPQVTGVMLRMGEHRGHLDYESFMLRTHRCARCGGQLESAIHRRTAEAVLAGLRPEQRLFYRTWVALGDTIHSDPAKLRQAFGRVRDDRLVPTMKNTSTDFWLHSPLNRTLGVGRHRQMAEFDCQRDMDGLQVVPTVLADRYRSRVAALKRRGVAGVWAWVCESGAPASGIRAFFNMGAGRSDRRRPAKVDYPVTYFRGFTRWTEANVYLLARFAWRASTPAADALAEWTTATFGRGVGPSLARELGRTERITRALVYLEAYNRAAGEWSCNMPVMGQSIVARYPYGWIAFTRDRNVHALLADIHAACGGDIAREIRAARGGVEQLKGMRDRVGRLRDRFDRPADARAIAANLDHALALGELLAAYRESFLRYYEVAAMLHGPIWAERRPEPGPFRRRRIVAAERRWPAELRRGQAALRRLETALEDYRRRYDLFATDQLDGYLEMARGFLDVVWLG